MYKYFITYRLYSRSKQHYQERLNYLKGYFGKKHVDSTTSTILAPSILDIKSLCEDIIKNCELLDKDNILVIKFNKGKENECYRIKNGKPIKLNGTSKWISAL